MPPDAVGPPADQAPIHINIQPGVVTSTSTRTMKFYHVTDQELDNLSLAHGLMVLFFSAASACAGLWIDIAKDFAFSSGQLSPEAKVWKAFAQPACFWGGMFFVACGLWAFHRKRQLIHKIKSESGEVAGIMAKCVSFFQSQFPKKSKPRGRR